MAASEEISKAFDRGVELTPTEIALEEAREAFHADTEDPEVREVFKAAQVQVAAERIAARKTREAAGPPADAVDVRRDITGRAFGWNTAAGDAAVAPGGVA